MITVNCVANSFVIIVDGTEDVDAFKKMVQRGTNLWPDAPVSIKEFADVVTNSQLMQDYQKLYGPSPKKGSSNV